MFKNRPDFYFEFAEENPDPKNPENNNPEPSDGTKKPADGGKEEHMIPKSRFDEVNKKYREIQKQLDDFASEKTKREQEIAENERKAKEEQGKYRELYDSANKELDGFKTQAKSSSERVKQLEAVINGLLEAKLEGVPEEFHDLIPGNLTPDQRLDWLAAAEKKGIFGASKKETPVGGNTNPAGNQVADLKTLSPIQMLRAAYGQK